MAEHIYHWKHGWIPLDHTAALSKAKGNHAAAAKMLEDAHGPSAGINSRQDVAKAALDLKHIPDQADHHAAFKQVTQAAQEHGATDLIPRSEQLAARAQAHRDKAAGIFNRAGVSDTAAGRLNARNLKQVHKHTDSSLRRYTEHANAAQELEHKAALAKSRETEAARQRLTAEDLQNADVIHDGTSWRRVVRTNAKSVTVETGYSWTDSVPIDKVTKHSSYTEPKHLEQLSTSRLEQIVRDAKKGNPVAAARLAAVKAILAHRGK